MSFRASYMIIGLALVLLAYFGWRIMLPTQPSVAQSSLPMVAKKYKRMLAQTRQTDKKPLSESEIRELANVFSNEPNFTTPEMEVLVFPGESIYTQGYETIPGSFAFLHVTPEIVRSDKGENVIRVKLESTELSLDGDMNTVVPKTMDIPLGKNQELFLLNKDGYHHISVEIGNDSNETGINMKLQNKYQTFKR